MTVDDRLVALGAQDRDTRDAEAVFARVVPLVRRVMLTDEVVAAARDGDAALVAEPARRELEAEPDEIAAVRELDDGLAPVAKGARWTSSAESSLR